jgi:hypothetical protein
VNRHILIVLAAAAALPGTALAQYYVAPAPQPYYVAPAPPPPVEQELPPLGAPQPAPPLPPPEMAPQAPASSETVTPNKWVPRPLADLQVLDKVEAVTHRVAVPVGQSTRVGSLTITVRACAVRPPDQPPDATGYLVITDSRPDEPGFQGWMLANEPWLAVLQSPLYDVRVTGCRT